ncbi:N-formylglutamate amidohydrolase [Agrococcus sediminis]|uniref:N-formylglutamate amidohydrolase n=1 Tax=Agrococcus sediminis TaxID=2599924 RepID=UPI001788CB05|nr:N-formylglutamate amidohydrolase [Agrococcus sediminis]
MILHAPHGSMRIPPAFRGHFVIDDAALERELLALTDHGVDRMVRRALESCDASAVIAGVSRLVVDVERFPGDEEEMNAVGMGVLYTHGAWRERIREVPDEARAELMGHFECYSFGIGQLVDRALEQHGRAVIVDVHSYASRPLPYELHAGDQRPPLCVGHDERHMTHSLLGHVRDAFRDLEQVDNEPFAGSYVPLKHFGLDSRVQSVMLELRRDHYMDEGNGRLDRAAVDALGDAIAQLAEAVAASG